MISLDIVRDMQSSSKPLYVRLPIADADRLNAVAASTGKSKRQLVSEAVRDHLDDGELAVGRIALREAPSEVMTLAQAAQLLQLDEPQVEESAKRGELPARRIGGEWRFSRAAVLAWLGGE
jgi:excisionase family DNA binding protein